MTPRFKLLLRRSLAAMLGACFGQSGLAAPVSPVQSPLPPGNVHGLGGYIGQRTDTTRQNYLKTFDINRYTAMVEQKTTTDWFWIGEQPGKWLEAAALASTTSGDVALESQTRAILGRLKAAQEPGGYLGITSPAMRSSTNPARGMDPYELYFTLHGLMTAAETLNDPAALQAARRLGDYFVANFGEGKAEFWPSPVRPPANQNTIICPQYTWVPQGTPFAPTLYNFSTFAGHTAHYGWEGTLLIDPMLRLHQLTGDASYLNWSNWVIGKMDTWSGWNTFAKLDDVASGTLGIHQLQPYVHSHTFHMNFLGFLRKYQITGDVSYLNKVKGAWNDIASRQTYITGGVSVGEHYRPGHDLPLTGHVVETCANMSWMELSQSLLELTGDVRHADAIERLLMNHVFAAQTVDGDSFRYHTPPNGFKPDDYFHGPDCCTSSGPRMVAMLPRLLYGKTDNAIFVNQYVTSTAAFPLSTGQVTLHQETQYPQSESIQIHMEMPVDTAFSLHVRLPVWCPNPSVTINGSSVANLTPGTYAALNRTWRHGDTVALTFPMQPHWIEHTFFTDGTAPWALIRGPLVYALDTIWWNDPTEPAPYDAGQQVRLLRGTAPLAEIPATTGALGPFYQTDVRLVNGSTAKATWVPFCNIGRWYRDGEIKPANNSLAYSYAVWLQDLQMVPTQTWDGVSADWNTPNWDSGNTWTSGNNAVINSGRVNVSSPWSANAITINNGGTVAIPPSSPDPFGLGAPSTLFTLNAGGVLSSLQGSHIGNVILAGGELAGAATDANFGSWWFQGASVIARGNTTSTISAAKMVLQTNSTNTFRVDAGSTLNVTGNFASAAIVATNNLNAGTLLKTGDGTMTLSGNNSYKGTTRVTDGALAFSGTSSGGNLQVNGSGALVQITGGTTTVASTGGDSYVIGGSAVEIAGGSLLVQGGSAWFSVGAHIANAGGAGTLTLTSGSFTINNSWGITVGAANRGTGTLNIHGGTFVEDDSIDNGIILGEGGGNGIVNLNGGELTADRIHVGTGIGTANFNGGKLMTTGAYSGTVIASYANLTANIQSGGLVVGGTNNTTIAQALVDGGGNGGLTKVDSNTVTLTAVNTYTGNTVVNEGVLSLQNACIHDSSSVTIATGAMMDLNFTGSDNVTSVTLGGTTYTTPGSYDVTTFPAFFTGGGSLVIPGANDYATWSGPSGYNLTEGPDGDDDKDGMTNLEEYAFDLVPTSGSSANPITSPLNKASGQFTYTRRDPVTKNTGLTYTVWTSTNLTDWNLESNSSAVQTPGTPDGNGIQSVVVTLTPIPTAPKLFIKVRAQ